MQQSIKKITVNKLIDEQRNVNEDFVAVEEPLEIRLEYGNKEKRIVKNISVTMRTPGQDRDLAIGFLFTEGIINSINDIEVIKYCFVPCAENKQNVIKVSLIPGIEPFLQNTDRNFYTTSSCGVCGKAAIGAIKTTHRLTLPADDILVDSRLIYQLPLILRQHQAVFAETGGLHASALFDLESNLISLREDVGRHNALDKLIGAALAENLFPSTDFILLLSGRTSFELVQKAAMAGIRIIVSVGAPSSLAIEIAQEFGITLAGFLRGNRFNIYSSAQRIIIPIHENTH